MDELSDKELLDALGVSIAPKKSVGRTPREERTIAGFVEIVAFVDAHGRVPQHRDEADIFERLYAVRLDRLRRTIELRDLLAPFDTHGLLANVPTLAQVEADDLDDAGLLSELGIETPSIEDITTLRHVRPREEFRTSEEIANRTPCPDFERFQPLFAAMKADLQQGRRETRPFGKVADIQRGDFFIVGGQAAYVAEVGEQFITDYDRPDSRLRVIYDNGTESDVLLRSLQRALYKDDAGRRIIARYPGPLFANTLVEDSDSDSGTIYVLRSKSSHPDVALHRDLIHKIGVTGGDVQTRVANAATDSTYLLADVEIVATYRLFNVNRSKLEHVIHRVFSAARLDLTIQDRFGQPVRPKEWFLVPLAAIDEAVDKIKDGSITEFEYDPRSASLVRQAV